MSAQQSEANGTEHRSGRPLATWILMLSAVVITLLLPDWRGTGALLPAGFMVVPILLGLVGAWLAHRAGRLGWAIASGVLGLVLVPGLIQTITLISGP